MKFIPHLIYVPDLHQISRKTTIIKVLSIKSSKIIRLLRKEKGEKELHGYSLTPSLRVCPGITQMHIVYIHHYHREI